MWCGSAWQSHLHQIRFWVSHSITQPADPGMLGEGVLWDAQGCLYY